MREAAKILTVSEKTVDRLNKSGELVGFKIRGRWFFFEREINNYLKRQVARYQGEHQPC
jgi:excisionase family DNA binding protein